MEWEGLLLEVFLRELAKQTDVPMVMVTNGVAKRGLEMVFLEAEELLRF